MTQSELTSKISGIINHTSHGTSFLYITHDKNDNTIIVGYKNASSMNSFGTEAITFQEIYDNLYPDLIKHGYINENK